MIRAPPGFDVVSAVVSELTVTAVPSALATLILPAVEVAEIVGAARLSAVVLPMPVAAARVAMLPVIRLPPLIEPPVDVRMTVRPVALSGLPTVMSPVALTCTLPVVTKPAGTAKAPVWLMTICPLVEFVIDENVVTAVVTEMPVAASRARVPTVTVLVEPLIELPVLRESEFVLAGEIGAEIVRVPADVEPSTSVPAVTRSSSASVSPSVSGEPLRTSAPPRLISVPEVRG